ncbi:unnamed protein product [Acidithrix sp. C25]|nr:unnamed protein product [Acidithrix sp. C25]
MNNHLEVRISVAKESARVSDGTKSWIRGLFVGSAILN